MSEQNSETNLVAHEDSATKKAATPAETPTVPDRIEELEDQERHGWPNQPTTS